MEGGAKAPRGRTSLRGTQTVMRDISQASSQETERPGGHRVGGKGHWEKSRGTQGEQRQTQKAGCSPRSPPAPTWI